MNREIKFRAFDGVDYITKPFTLLDIQNGKLQLASSDTIIMQFTGLKDKNEKDIYENDIVKSKTDFGEGVSEIIWDEYSCCFTSRTLGTHIMDKETEFEILGNIYENPELLTK